MKDFYDDRGLINSRMGEEHSENSPLYTVQNVFLKSMLGEDCKDEVESLIKFYDRCEISPGLYNQRPLIYGSHDDYMSHDQLTAMICFFKGIGRHDKVMAILAEIKRQGGHYDNLNPNDPNRLLRPYDRWFYQQLVGECGFLKWMIVEWVLEYSCMRVWKVRPEWWNRIIYFFKHFKFQDKRKMIHTDGKLLAFVKCQSVLTITRDYRVERLWGSLCDIINEHEAFIPLGWTKVFSTYFPHNHPNTILARKIWK